MSSPYVPDLPEGCSTYDGALAYANAGLFILPIVPSGTKHAGSVVGKRWQDWSSRNPEQIAKWYTGNKFVARRGIALHAGPSNLVIIDADNPDKLTPAIRAAIEQCNPPCQITRTDGSRAHYLFTVPNGWQFSNSSYPWGQIRAGNGVIISAPSEHEKASENGTYEWKVTGAIPELPAEVANELKTRQRTGTPDLEKSEYIPPATDAEVEAFLDKCKGNEAPELIEGVLSKFDEWIGAGKSRHDSARDAACWGAREALVNAYPAKDFFEKLGDRFVKAMQAPRRVGCRVLSTGWAIDEFCGITRWAIGRALDDTPEKIVSDIRDRVPTFGVKDTNSPDFEAAVNKRLIALQAEDEARRRLRKQTNGTTARPNLVTLDEFLDEPDQSTRYRIDGLLPVDGRVILAAQYKSGKTITMGNCIRALADRAAFLGRFPVNRPDGRIALLDNESPPGQLRSWIRDQGIKDRDRILVETIRGRLSVFDIMDPSIRREWAALFRASEVRVLIVDCLRPLLDAVGLDEHRDAGRYLIALDELADSAGVGELIVVHHMGHNGERSRGDSRLRDWPDAEWSLMRYDENPASPRFFRAFGRDV
ncbi:MAG: bifunctional DNA primase/polymerase, partial [Actinobacteria bacterium]|nr:bifunctional DNA primase/polymerase [Actinomycetota bacterium]